ncbi:hypothetical protein GS634_15555 [Ruegeria atlantica]|uniref:Uncharacterized protein n=1 Tax=Ruegeria atlantica TaxID=81569 RepID=A0AA91BUX4_9RHOB|nr:hypothetical protein [Ruegeria atlantica]NOE19543.1 hypothetical protein [Ruegeria atlantica]
MRPTIPAEQAEALFKKFAQTVPVAKIPKFIGCTRAQASLLLQSGILSPVIKDDGDTSGRHKGVDADSLNELIDAMRQLGSSVAESSEGMLNIGETAGALNVPSMDVLALLLDGRLNKIELLPIGLKFKLVLVNLEEVAKKLGVKACQTGLTISEASREILVPTKTVRFLLRARDPNGYPALKSCGQVRHMGEMHDLVDQESLRSFKARYGILRLLVPSSTGSPTSNEKSYRFSTWTALLSGLFLWQVIFSVGGNDLVLWAIWQPNTKLPLFFH